MMKVVEVKVAPDMDLEYAIIKVFDNGSYVGDIVMKSTTFAAMSGRMPIVDDEYDVSFNYIDY